MRLSEVCEIHSGYTARNRLEPATTGGVPVIQLRDLSGDGELPGIMLQRFELKGLADRYLVHGGEVLFRSRGDRNTAMAVSVDMPEPAAVILPLVILRPDPAAALPAYLAWAINQPDAQRRLAAEAQGTNMRMIPKAVLERLEIPLPDIVTQQRIATIDTLARRESDLLRALADQRHRFHNLLLAEHAMQAPQQGSRQQRGTTR